MQQQLPLGIRKQRKTPPPRFVLVRRALANTQRLPLYPLPHPLNPEMAKLTSRPDRANYSHAENIFLTHWLEVFQFGRPRDIESPATREFEQRFLPIYQVPFTDPERRSYVLSSLAQWLGTKCGAAFLERSKHHSKWEKCDLETAILAVWEIDNNPPSCINHGIGTLRSVLHPFAVCDLYPPELNPISNADWQLSQAFMRWIATDEGQKFIAEAERRLKIHKEQESRYHHLRYNLGVLADGTRLAV